MANEVQHRSSQPSAATALERLEIRNTKRKVGRARGGVGSSGVLLGALDARLDPDEVRAVWRADGPDDTTDLALRCEACVAELVAHLTLDKETERAASRTARALRVLLVSGEG